MRLTPTFACACILAVSIPKFYLIYDSPGRCAGLFVAGDNAGAISKRPSAVSPIREEVYQHFNALPHDHMIMAERNREALETLGVW